MKKINQIVALLMVGLLMISCAKEDKVIFDPDKAIAPEFTQLASTYTLAIADKEKPMTPIEWSKADLGFNSAVEYILQAKLENGATFKRVETFAGKTKWEMTVGEFNSQMIAFCDEGVANNVVFRVVAKLSTNNQIISKEQKVVVTPYADVLPSFPTYEIAGELNGWGATPIYLYSVNDDKIYNGYVNFSADGFDYKFRKDPTWSENYGGALNALTPGGGNMDMPKAGYYYFDLNIPLLKADTMEVRVVALVGDATPNGWGADTPLTYNPTTKVWGATMNMENDKFFKLKLNHDWSKAYGAGSKNGYFRRFFGEGGGEGGNIRFTGATGAYRVEVRLEQSVFTYKFIAQE